MMMELSKPALATYLPSTLKETPLASDWWAIYCAIHFLMLISQKVRLPSTWPTQERPEKSAAFYEPLTESTPEGAKAISFMSPYAVPSIEQTADLALTSQSLIYLSVPTLIAYDPSWVTLIE
jgi:hypothetical protein